MNKTGIEWTTFTANPVKYRRKSDGKPVWACVKTSPGCARCYSEAIALRFDRGKVFNAQSMEELEPFLDEKELKHMRTAKTIGGVAVSGSRCFVGDMTDMFGEWIPDDLLNRLFSSVLEMRQDVEWQVLTKRAARLQKYLSWRWGDGRIACHNITVGVSVENQQYADERIPLLLQTPAAVRFLSVEPMLGAIDLSRWLRPSFQVCKRCNGRISLDNQVGQDKAEQSDSVVLPVDAPTAHRLPPAALSSLAVPSNESAGKSSVQPLDHLGSGAVDGDSGAISSVRPSPPVKVSFTVEQSGNIPDDGRIGRQGNSSREELRPAPSTVNSSRYQDSPDGFSSDIGISGDVIEAAPGLVRGDHFGVCQCGVLRSPYCTTDLGQINWCICGGESGPNARPMDLAWARSIVRQCKAAVVPVFVKQLGASPYYRNLPPFDGRNQYTGEPLKDKKGGDIAEFPGDLRVREFPKAVTP